MWLCQNWWGGGNPGWGLQGPPQDPLMASCITDKTLLYTELLARLLYFVPSHPALVGPLCQEAQSWFRHYTDPTLVPLAGFLQPPGDPLQATLTGCHKGKSQGLLKQ